ncbi:MAG: hypothetical protein LUQ65_04120 [Candidatus Helarchaeota archaeon]|nr:hypothetical protein [Candidatus Helarchaeota archaeon]
MPKMEDKRKLCPRCGSPLMDEEGTLRCHLCGYSKGAEGARATIKYAEPEARKKATKEVKLYKVLPSGITSATELEKTGVFLVADSENNTIWLWKGAEAKAKDVYNAGTAATKLKTSEKLFSAKLTHVEEGKEPMEFPLKGGKKLAKKEAPTEAKQTVQPIEKEMISEAQEAISIAPPAPGQVNIYLINKGQLQKIDQPVFTSGDSYIVDGGKQIWIWIGKGSSVDEKFSAAHLSTVIDVSRRGEPKVTTVDQGSEPKELKVALGGLKIVDSNVAETLLKKVQKAVYEPVLYRISSEEFETINDIVYKQVPCVKESLDSEDTFLLDDKTNNKLYIWVGSKSNAKEKVVAGQIARKFDTERAGVQEATFIEEGHEPPEFKKLVGMPI